MKVKISETIEVSDDERVAIAARLDGAGGKKRKATSAEMKEFIWQHGRDWPLLLRRSGEFQEELDLQLEDLI